ncbi:MAG: prepilin peptidase [Planctomycetaceae bacterium]
MTDTVLHPYASPGWAVLGPVAGVVAGFVVSRASTWMLWSIEIDPAWQPTTDSVIRDRRTILASLAACLAMLALFFWEVALGGQLPKEGMAGNQLGQLLVRLAAHGMLGSLLIMATVVDLRHRVIPDLITVPGALVGMLFVTCVPDVLLPVTCEVPRAFAAPLSVLDVLGAFGPLQCEGIEGVQWRSLLAPACFLAWWSVCTSPSSDPRWWRDPRTGIFVTGMTATIAVTIGGAIRLLPIDHPAAMEASLVGAVVSGGLVLATRAAASRAVGREAMGMGDVTLMAMVGSWCGWQLGVVAFFLAAFLGLAQGAWGWLRHRDNELPYGPSLSLASFIVIIAWRSVWAAGRPLLESPSEMAVTLAVVVVLTGIALAVWARLRRP